MAKLELITTADELTAVINKMSESTCIAVDTEFLREKTYYPLLCLIQIRSQEETYCIDAIEIEDLDPLQALFAGNAPLKIFHACQQDTEALDQRLDQSLSGLYDTQIAAAFCGFGDQVSYASLVESVCGIKLNKSQTRTDWSARPLSLAQMQYAGDDVLYLDDIHSYMDEQLERLGRKKWHQIECQRALESKSYVIAPEDAWKRLRGGAKLPKKLQPSAKALSVWRERKAQQQNRPREWILSTRTLIDICYRQPTSLADLGKLDSVNQSVVKNSGHAILNTLNKDVSEGNSTIWEDFQPLSNKQKAQVRAILNKLKQTVERENLSQSLLANRRDVEKLVLGEKDISLLQGWRFEFIGKAIVDEFG